MRETETSSLMTILDCRERALGLPDVPDPKWVRGECPQCGQALVSNMYYIGNRGYLVTWDCWASLGDKPTCNYRKVL